MNTITSLRLRVFRFLGERYYRRECPSYLAELFLFAVIVIMATWPMFSLASAMATMK